MDVLGILCLGFMAIYFINGCRKGFFINLIESIKAIGVIILAVVFCETAGNYVLESSVDKGKGVNVTVVPSIETVPTVVSLLDALKVPSPVVPNGYSFTFGESAS